MRRSLLTVFVVGFTVVLATVWGAHSQQQDSKPGAERDATPVTEGQFTARQIEHSKLYTQSGRQRKLTTSPTNTSMVIGLPWRDVSTDGLTLDDVLRDMTCRADAVVVATVTSKASQLTTDATFVFTDYALSVTDALKNNPMADIRSKSTITVTRPGGVVSLNGKIISVRVKSFRPLEVNKAYLLFLTYLPSTGAYQSISSEGSFEITNNQLLRMTEETLSHGSVNHDGDAILSEVRAFASNCSRQAGGR